MGKCIGLLVLMSWLVSCETKDSFSIKETKTLYKGKGLENVESVLYDEQNQALYITNGMDYVPGTDGFISKASVDGNHLDLKWVAGLNRPTGMALKGNTLYVADLLALIGINTETGEIVERYIEPIAGSALNDVAIDGNGDIYVSASRLGAVFKLIDGELQLWTQDKLQMKYANGLLAKNDKLLVAGFNLSSIYLQSGELTALTTQPSIKDLESLIEDGQGGYFLTTVGQSALYQVTENMNATPLLEEESDYLGDLSFDQQSNTLFIPRGNEDTEVYYITALQFNK